MSENDHTMVELVFNPDSLSDYQTFLRVKTLPVYSFTGRSAFFPSEYADRIGLIEPPPPAPPLKHRNVYAWTGDGSPSDGYDPKNWMKVENPQAVEYMPSDPPPAPTLFAKP